MDKIARTAHDDAPLAAARHPDLAHYNDLPAVSGDESLVSRAVTINQPRQQVYEFWREFTNLPRFMENIQAVEILDEIRSHWIVAAPAGKTVEWDAEVTQDIPGALIEWQSMPDASVKHSGKVEFLDSSNDRGTVVRVTLAYEPPGGSLGKMVAKLFAREPNIQARRDMRRLKQLLETGELSTSAPGAAAPRS